MSAKPPRRRNRSSDDDLFDAQPSSSSELPEPRPHMERLALVSCEILAGLRSPDQVARWVSDDVYRMLTERSISARRRSAGTSVGGRTRPHIEVYSARVSEPRDGIVEGVVLVRVGPRTRAVCIRLEGLDRRWRASAFALL